MFFTDMDEGRLREILKMTVDLEILELWITGGVRPGREGVRRLIVLLCRKRQAQDYLSVTVKVIQSTQSKLFEKFGSKSCIIIH